MALKMQDKLHSLINDKVNEKYDSRNCQQYNDYDDEENESKEGTEDDDEEEGSNDDEEKSETDHSGSLLHSILTHVSIYYLFCIFLDKFIL